MKILFDYQIFLYQKFGGVSRYFVEIIEGLKKENAVDVDLCLLYSHNEHLIEKKLQPGKPWIKGIKGERRFQNIIKYFNQRLVKKKLRRGVDIFHPTYYENYYLDSLGNAKFVLTIYDMIHELQLILHDKSSNEVVANKKILALRASKIVAISESTKRDIVAIYGIAPDKIEVIHLASSLVPRLNYKPTVSIPEKYILFVGNRKGYKNFDLFFRSIVPLLKKDKNLHIVAAGSSKFLPHELKIIDDLNLSTQIIHLSIDDSLLAYLYQNAICFVFPSKYEGFGIPTLEAFACGCPVVLSNTSSMPEVGGDAVIYIEPDNEQSIFEGIKQIVENEELRNTLKKKGYQQLKKFSWKQCTEHHHRLYARMMSS